MMTRTLFPTRAAAALAVVISLTPLARSDERTWTSSSGSTMRGEIVGVKDGKVLIRPVTPPREVPISSLSKKDQEFIANWEKDEVERLKTAKAIELERHMDTPLLKGLKGNLQKFEDDKLVPYDIPEPGKLELVAVYYTANNWEGKKVANPALKEMSKIYKRLVRRYPHFELVLYPLEERETDLMVFMDEEKILFPTLKHSETMTESGMAVRAPFAGSFPNLLLLDRDGKVLLNSAAEAGKAPNWDSILGELEDIVKKRAPKDEEE